MPPFYPAVPCPSPPRAVNPLTHLEHLGLNCVKRIHHTFLVAIFDCLAYPNAALKTLECRQLLACYAMECPFKSLAGHLKGGAFPALSSMTIHDSDLQKDIAAAMVEGMDKSCRAVTLLSLARHGNMFLYTHHRKLLNALLQIAEDGSESTLRPVTPFRSLQTLHLNFSNWNIDNLLKCLFDIDIQRESVLFLTPDSDDDDELFPPSPPVVRQADFSLPFPALSSLALPCMLQHMCAEEYEKVLQKCLESGVRDIYLSGNIFSEATVIDVVAFLRSFLPCLGGANSVSEERPVRITREYYRDWNDELMFELESNLPPGCEIVLGRPFCCEPGLF